MKRTNVSLIKTVLLIIAIVICIFPRQVEAKKFRWKLFLYYPPQVAENFQGWCDDIREQTDGNLDIKIFYHGEHPFKAADLFSALKDRSCEMANVNSAYIGGVAPILNAFELPMIAVNSQEHLYVVNHIREKWYDSVLESEHNQKLILWTCYPGQAAQTRDTFIESLDSLKGRKLRIYSKDTANWANVLNATPVTIPWAEVYTAAQRGVIDGATGCLGTAYDSKFYEVFKHITVTEFIMAIDGINVNMDAWKELPAEYQKIVMETGKKWQYKYWLRRELANMKKNVLAQQLYGCSVRYMDPSFRKKVVALCKEKVWPDWVNRTKQPAKANAYIAAVEKYRDKYMSMPKEKQIEWLKANAFPVEVLN
jgi:TRAP-type C4-dicarboxylate transport system substrate-binding protein